MGRVSLPRALGACLESDLWIGVGIRICIMCNNGTIGVALKKGIDHLGRLWIFGLSVTTLPCIFPGLASPPCIASFLVASCLFHIAPCVASLPCLFPGFLPRLLHLASFLASCLAFALTPCQSAGRVRAFFCTVGVVGSGWEWEWLGVVGVGVVGNCIDSAPVSLSP